MTNTSPTFFDNVNDGVVRASHSIHIAGNALEQITHRTNSGSALKFGIFVHPKRPKVFVEQTATQLQSAGFLCSPNEPDVAIVVGGDGTFGYYGRILAVSMLFVGVKENGILGSKARLAEPTYDRLDNTLQDINVGSYGSLKKGCFR